MLKKDTLTKIAALLKLDVAKLEAAAKDTNEVDIEIPETITLFSAEELTARDEVKIGEGKKLGFKDGENKGQEIVVRELKKQFGVELEGWSLSKLSEAIKNQLSKGDDGLKEQIKLLQKTIEEKEGLINSEKQKSEIALRDASLLGKLPANKVKTLSNDEHLMIVKANLEFTPDGIKYKGNVIRDPKTQNPLDEAAAIEHFYNDRKLIDVAANGASGRGNGNSVINGKPKNKTEAINEWQTKNPDKKIMSEEFQVHLMELAKNPEFNVAE